MTTLSVFDSDDMRRVCTRISHEIIERNNGAESLVLLGLVTRGALFASRLAKNISDIEDARVPVYSLDISEARDDREILPSGGPTFPNKQISKDLSVSEGADLSSAFPQVLRTETNVDLTQSNVVLVDDVLYTGRSIRAAMDVVSRISRPQRVQLAVLIDRGHRELPIRADFIGKNLPTKRSERVNVLMEELDGADRIDIERVDTP